MYDAWPTLFTFNEMDHAVLEKPRDLSIYISPKMVCAVQIIIDEFGLMFEQEVANPVFESAELVIHENIWLYLAFQFT